MTSRATQSLLGGRSLAPLTDDMVRRVGSIFVGLDNQVPARHDEHGKTCFEVIMEDGQAFGVVYFGSDIFPGSSTVDPNANLSVQLLSRMRSATITAG